MRWTISPTCSSESAVWTPPARPRPPTNIWALIKVTTKIVTCQVSEALQYYGIRIIINDSLGFCNYLVWDIVQNYNMFNTVSVFVKFIGEVSWFADEVR